MVLAMGFCLLAGKYVRHGSHHIKQEKRNELSAIADLKVNQIAQWRNHWLASGNEIKNDAFLIPVLKKWLHDHSKGEAKKSVLDWIDREKKYAGFLDVQVYDSRADKLLSVSYSKSAFPVEMLPFVLDAVRCRAIQFTDFHRRAGDGKIHFDMIVPLEDRDASGKSVGLLCVLVFSIDPEQNLFPLIQSWPTPSTTSETLLLHRQGDSVVYINELRHRKNTALSFKLPIGNENLPAAMAIKGQEGIVEGIDYRGVAVIAMLRHIPDSPWYMVAKVDKKELYAPLRREFFVTLALLLCLIVLTGAVIITVERSHSSRHFRLLYEQQRQTQSALLDSEHFIRTIIASAQEGIIVYDSDLRYKVFNSFMERITGMDAQSVIGKSAFDIFPHLREQGVDRLLERALSGETVQSPDTMYTVAQTGKTGWVTGAYGPHRSADGSIMGVVAIVKDITDRKNAEEALAAQREQLAVTLRSIGDGVISAGTDGRIVLMNKAAENLTGWPLQEAFGRPLIEVFRIINEITRAPCENPVDKVLKTGDIVSLANHTLLVNRNGKEMIIVDSGAPIRDKNSVILGVVLVFRDNTDKQRANENMIKAEKLESIGVLAGGIAHDFNNLLGGIFGYVDLAREMAAGNENVTTTLSKALNVFNRARDLTRQLLTFAKGGAPSKKTASLGPIITEMAHFALSGSNVRCAFSIPSDLLPCDIDKNQIGQVIDNIVINALQAMPQGGEISIRAENLTLQSGANGLPLSDGGYVRISIKDQGAGIPREYLNKIFDPFFTTKQKGSGLGLATCFSIIQKHEGFIDVESELGKGSVFSIYLPASPASLVADSMVSGMKNLNGSGRILVMDDEDFIREVANEMLTRMGYEVAQASGGEEAISIVKNSIADQKPFQAVILDLTIPGGMGGKAVIKALLAMDPNIKAIASSGYSDDPVMAQPERFGFKGKIKKPYLKEELGEILLKVMNHAG